MSNFRTGVKEIKLRGKQVLVSLNYSPRTDNLQMKLGNLPVKYLRLDVENDTELKLLEEASAKYRFGLSPEANEVFLEKQQKVGFKRPLEGVMKKERGKSPKIRILESRCISQPSSPSSKALPKTTSDTELVGQQSTQNFFLNETQGTQEPILIDEMLLAEINNCSYKDI